MQADSSPTLVGVLHLLALPGAPMAGPGVGAVQARAVADARALYAGGVRHAIIENLGDAPFTGRRVGPEVVAYMTRIALAVRAAVPELRLGVNVLRNDGAAAVAVAAAVEATFVRVNVLAGASWTDQGLIQGAAREVLLLRRRLQQDGAPSIRIAADICVKHGVPAGEHRRVHAARDTAGRGGADILIVTGAATGAPADISDIPDIRAVGRVPVWIGSGVTHASAAAVARVADGAIVGTALHEDADISRPLCSDRVRDMLAAFRVA